MGRTRRPLASSYELLTAREQLVPMVSYLRWNPGVPNVVHMSTCYPSSWLLLPTVAVLVGVLRPLHRVHIVMQ